MANAQTVRTAAGTAPSCRAALALALLALHPAAASEPAAAPAARPGTPGVEVFQKWTSQCEETGNAEACAWVGMAFLSGKGLPRDPARAEPFLRKACDLDARTCAGLGLLRQCATPPDLTGAAALFARACEQGEPQGCHLLGLAARRGAGVPRDPARAARLQEGACAGGVAAACAELGAALATGDGVRRDVSRALPLLERSCDASDAVGCLRLGDALAHGGEGVARDVVRARAAHDRACRLGAAAGCDRLKQSARATPSSPAP
jgi:TPR repeat protein